MTIDAPPDPALYTGTFERQARKLVKQYGFSDDVTIAPLNQSENTVLLVDDRERAEKYVLRIHSHRLDYHRAAMIASALRFASSQPRTLKSQ